MDEIKITKIDTGYEIETDNGKIQLSWAEICCITRFCDHTDTLNEIKEYIAEFDDESSISAFGKKAASITGDKVLMEKITETIIKNRISDESTDDIYNAIREVC